MTDIPGTPRAMDTPHATGAAATEIPATGAPTTKTTATGTPAAGASGTLGTSEASGATGASEAAAARRPAWRGHVRFGLLSVLPPLLLFGSAGRVDWGMGWLYVGVVFAMTLGTRVLALRLCPGLIAERDGSFAHRHSKSWDKIIVAVIAGVAPLAMWITAGLGARFAWQPRIGAGLAWLGVVAIVAGSLLAARAMLANPFFSGVVRIQQERGHRVIESGPYRLLRHPGYAGMLAFNLGTPLALDAVWAFVPAGVVIAMLVVRTALEDRTLRAELGGYADYARRTRYRLVPGIW